MPYTSWSVTFGEQPSAAKWNILGTNDASFNDGTGIGTGAISATALATNSVTTIKIADLNVTGAKIEASPTIVTPTIVQINNSTEPGVKLQLNIQTDDSNSIANATMAGVYVQRGYGQMVGDGSTSISETVTFDTAYTTPLGVMCTWIGQKATSAAANITQFTASTTNPIQINARSISTTGFTMAAARDVGTFGATTYYGYCWEAWGV